MRATRATFFTFLLAVGGGVSFSSALVFYSCLGAAVWAAKEPASPIHHAPKRPSLEWASEGTCKPFSNDCRIAGMGGTP